MHPMGVRDEGGQAFPHSGEGLGREFATPGMTLRDYFIAHAPPVPEWFAPSWPNPTAFTQAEYMRQACLQWPVYWANAMLKERAK